MEEPTSEEYERKQAECKQLLIAKGSSASLMYGSLFALALFAFHRVTALGTIHPYAILGTAGFVTPFWVVGENAVRECQRGLFDTRKELLAKRFEKERFNAKD